MKALHYQPNKDIPISLELTSNTNGINKDSIDWPFVFPEFSKEIRSIFQSSLFHIQIIPSFAIKFAMLIFTIAYAGDCPAKICIPAFLPVHVVAETIIFMFHICSTIVISLLAGVKYEQLILLCLIILLKFFFVIGWFITGTVWVYDWINPIQFERFNHQQAYRQRSIYYAAFTILLMQYIGVGYLAWWILKISHPFIPMNGKTHLFHKCIIQLTILNRKFSNRKNLIMNV